MKISSQGNFFDILHFIEPSTCSFSKFGTTVEDTSLGVLFCLVLGSGGNGVFFASVDQFNSSVFQRPN